MPVQDGVLAVRNHQCAELALGEAVLVHVAPRPKGEIDRLGVEAIGFLERLLGRIEIVERIGTAGTAAPIDAEIADDHLGAA